MAGRLPLVPVGAALPRYVAWGPHVSAAQFHPDAAGDRLALTVDFYGWMLLNDGRLDDLLARGSDATAAFVAELADVIDHGSTASGKPLAVALLDLWCRWKQGMSAAWVNRAARHWREFLSSRLKEATNREHDTALTVEQYLDLRARTGMMAIILDLAERLNHAEVPPPAINSEACRPCTA
ncbi:MAG: hypothetical protein QOG94_1800 [Solirubrobacteraceae bacterium]|nr:hypothetical protein [Solirubrobacteraceae bacterium]